MDTEQDDGWHEHLVALRAVLIDPDASADKRLDDAITVLRLARYLSDNRPQPPTANA